MEFLFIHLNAMDPYSVTSREKCNCYETNKPLAGVTENVIVTRIYSSFFVEKYSD